jgi:hypothetical protein
LQLTANDVGIRGKLQIFDQIIRLKIYEIIALKAELGKRRALDSGNLIGILRAASHIDAVLQQIKRSFTQDTAKLNRLTHRLRKFADRI